jgi:hypothetical protein
MKIKERKRQILVVREINQKAQNETSHQLGIFQRLNQLDTHSISHFNDLTIIPNEIGGSNESSKLMIKDSL